MPDVSELTAELGNLADKVKEVESLKASMDAESVTRSTSDTLENQPVSSDEIYNTHGDSAYLSKNIYLSTTF